MAYTVLIPARLASTRLPNKPLADIGGVPMVVRVAQRVRAGVSPSVRIVVAGDHASIVSACQTHGIEAILTREDMRLVATVWQKPATSWVCMMTISW